MIKDLFGPTSLPAKLRGALEEASATHRAISRRVANADTSSTSVDFSTQLDANRNGPKTDEADLQRDMGALADTQLRYEADAKLLQAAYAQFRTAVSDRA